jgi:peptide/nickel transport system permease protein
VFVLFGYIARMARAGTIEALDSDYVRTAILKGLPRSVVIRRHVLRNSLLPTITVIAANNKDFAMLEAGVLVIGIVYLGATLIADILYTILNPRIRYEQAE